MKKSIKNFAVLLVSATMLAGCGETKPETYKVKFVSEGQTMYETTVEKGSVVDYKGTAPTKEADENNKAYTFAGWKNGENVWNLATDVVNADTTLTAYFNATARGSFTVSLVDDDGTTSLGSVSVKEGFAATKPEDPVKQEDAQFKYTFKGWMLNDAAYDWSLPVNSNLTLKASWQKEVQKYDIKFMNGEVPVKEDNLEYGATIVAPQDDLTYDKDGYHYDFLGWTKEGSTDVVTNFGTVTGNATYNAKFDTPELIKYTATIKFDYEGGPSDSEIEFDATNRADKLLEIKDLLPDGDEDTIYEWKEALPEVLPFEDCDFTIIANCKYYSVDMSKSEINKNISLVDRSGSANLAIENNALKFKSSNDVFFSTRSYTNFDLEFNLKTPVDQFSVVLGANKDTMNKNFGEGAPGSATNGVAFIVVKPMHSSSRVRPYGNGAQIESCPNNPAIPTLSATDPLKVKLHFEGNYFEVYFNDTLEVAREFAANAYTPGGYVGIFAPGATMEFTSFSFAKVIPTDEFETDFSNNLMPRGLVFNGRSGETYSISEGVLTTSTMINGHMYTKASLEELTVEFEIKLNGRFAVEVGAKDTSAGYADGKSSIQDKYVAFYFMNNNVFFIDNDTDRTGKDGAGIQSFATSVAFNGSSFVKVKIDFHGGKFNVSLNNTAIITNVSPTNEVSAGHIIIARASTNVAMNFDSFSLKY